MPSFDLKQEPKHASSWTVLGWNVEKKIKPIAKAVRLPFPILLALIGLLLIAAALIPFKLIHKSAVNTLDTVPPIHIVKVQVSQIGELDITTYLELENRLREMGFQPLIQMTVPQAPSPNYIAVFIKENSGTYAELLKMPGSLTPRVSYVTVFSNGLWCSTNGWEGKDIQDEFLISTHHPGDSPKQLYIKHIQHIEQLKKQDGWSLQRMNENRYITAFTDLFRWFLVKKKIPGYRASFDQWH